MTGVRGLAETIRLEVAAGLPRLRGSRVDVYLPIRQPAIDAVLRLIPGVPGDLAIEIGDDRHLQVSYGVFRAGARLHHAAVAGPAPVVVLSLASQLVAWGLRAVTLPPFVSVSGRDIEIHLAAVPALRDLAPAWRHVSGITFDSTPGRLDVRASVDIA